MMNRSKRKRRIHALAIDEKNVDCIWELLKNAIEEIQKQNNSHLSFEELYSNAYTMVFHRHGEMLYTGLKELIKNHLITKVRLDLLGSLNNNFLQRLNQTWNDHQTSMLMIRDILMYMDRVYVKQNDVDNVYNLGLIAFRDEIIRYNCISDYLTETLLELINRERKGETIDRMLIKTVSHMLIILGINSRWLYVEEFETPYLKQSEQYYRIISQKLLELNNASVYINNVKSLIDEELDRVKHYLDKSTECFIITILENELIKNHLKTIVEMENSIVEMLLNNCTEDLACIYNLFSRVPDGLKTIYECINSYFKEETTSLVNSSTNSQTYIQNILDFKDRSDHLLSYSFNYDEILKLTFTEYIKNALNLNNKSPEFLAIFIDNKLRGIKGMSEQEIESILDKTIFLYKLLQDKDIFEKYYKIRLVKRLLLDKSFSDDIERNMIAKLKPDCNSLFIIKVERMLKDLIISDTVKCLFKIYSKNTDVNLYGIDLNIRTLTACYWPILTNAPNVIIPSETFAAFNVFRTFYTDNHKERHLTLLPQLGNADLIAIFFDNIRKNDEEISSNETEDKTRKYILQVSTYQMCVLMLFNEKNHLTYEEIQKETLIPEKDLNIALQSLAMGKISQRILNKIPNTNDIQRTHVFNINNDFQSKLFRIKILPYTDISKGELDNERKKIKNKIDEDRKYKIEAAIIRVMKARQQMHHYELISEVVELLRSRFLASQVVIKASIEKLIEKEYLARTKQDRRVYTYIA